MTRDPTSDRDMLRPLRRILGRADGASGPVEEAFRALAEVVFEGVAVVEGGRISEANKAFASIFGYEQSAVVGRALPDLVAPEARGLLEKCLSSGLAEPYEVVGVRKDGTPLKLEVRASSYGDPSVHLIAVRDVTGRDEAVLVQDEGGKPLGRRGVMTDVTGERRAEEALRESEERYRLVARATNEVIWDNDLTTGKQVWDGAIEAMFGCSPEEVGDEASWWEERIHPDDRERVLSRIETALEEDKETWSDEYRFRRADGSYATVVDRGYVIRDPERGHPIRLVGSMMDVTERKRAEAIREANRRLQERFRSLVQNTSDIITVVDAEAAITYESPAVERILGYKPEERVGTNLLDLVHRDDVEWVRHKLDEVLERRQARSSTWYRIRDRKGFLHYFEAVVVNLLDEPGVQGIVVNQRDITERRRAEEELRRSEASLAEAQRMAHLGSWEWDVVNDEVHWSDEVFRIYGFEPRSFVPTLERLVEVVHPDDREALKVAIDGALYRGEPYDFEHRIVRPDGEVRVVHRRGEVIRDEDGKPIKMVGTAHDISERKRAEEDIREANRRLEELAILKADFTAMVAHELDTPLAVIRGYADMLATGELDLDEHTRALDRIQTETDLLEALVSDVRAAAVVEREDFTIEPQRVRIETLLRDAAAFVETLPGSHQLVTRGAADGWVFADPHRVGQVLRNLLSNAAKYSPEGAPIELRTMPGARSAGRVRIEVADQGGGIHPDDAARIFEKFGRGRDRTGTKVAGAGLGLYLSRRILQAHGSELTLDSGPGGGSVFGFDLEDAK